MSAALFIIAAFTIGAVPFGVIVSRLFFSTDIRATGSGNIGAANALRSLGKKGGAAVLLLDVLKGFVPTAMAIWLHLEPAIVAAIAFATVAGHCYSPWLGFRGGKGVATFLGALFALSWPAGLLFIGVWLVAFRASAFASLASLTSAVLSPAFVFGLGRGAEAIVCAFGCALLILWKHRANIERLRAGTEAKLILRKNA